MVSEFLTPVDDGAAFSFSQPRGEPALVMPDSVSWRIFKNPVTLFIGGVTAVILELAEPRVREGVWEHTNFRRDPLRRLQRTGFAAMVTVYGPHSHARALISKVRSMHDRIAGRTPAGQAYHANDPELLNWVHVTASFGFLEAYKVYAQPLNEYECNRFYAEGKTAARLFGVIDPPFSEQAVRDLFAEMHANLEPSAIITEFLEIMCHASILPLPAPFKSMQKSLVMAAVDLVPLNIRQHIGLEAWSPRPVDKLVAQYLGKAANRILIRSSPAVQSCLRMGLPEDFLF